LLLLFRRCNGWRNLAARFLQVVLLIWCDTFGRTAGQLEAAGRGQIVSRGGPLHRQLRRTPHLFVIHPFGHEATSATREPSSAVELACRPLVEFRTSSQPKAVA
jgi:hypothetical protein